MPERLPIPVLMSSLVTLLTEAYAGPADPRETWFVDHAPDAGILGLIAGISEAEASASMAGTGARGSTIAANVEHLRWSLANVNKTLRGQGWNPDWAASWELLSVDEAGWNRLREALREEFETLCGLLRQQVALPAEHLLGLLALAPHAAWHLGLMRQMIERVREEAAADPVTG